MKQVCKVKKLIKNKNKNHHLSHAFILLPYLEKNKIWTFPDLNTPWK